MYDLVIRPSSAFRWLKCPGQPRVQAVANRLPQPPEPDYTAEGTAAHAWLEHYLGGMSEPPETDIPNDQKVMLGQIADDIEWYAETMGYSVQTEVGYELQMPIGDVERDPNAWYPIKMHADVVLRNETDLVVLDYKHGAGRPVEVQGNPQTLLYLAGAYQACKTKPQNMAMGIIQPRGRGDGWQQVQVTHDQLTTFKRQVHEAIDRAFEDQVEYISGPHCWRCQGRQGLCPATLALAIDCCVLAKGYDQKLTVKTMENTFGGVAPWPLLDISADVKAFLKTLDEYADVWLKSGRSISGWGIASTPGRRRWENPAEVPGVLAELLGGRPEDYQKKIDAPPPINMTDAERLAKRKGVSIDGLIKKPVVQKRMKMENSETGDINPGFSAVE